MKKRMAVALSVLALFVGGVSMQGCASCCGTCQTESACAGCKDGEKCAACKDKSACPDCKDGTTCAHCAAKAK